MKSILAYKKKGCNLRVMILVCIMALSMIMPAVQIEPAKAEMSGIINVDDFKLSRYTPITADFYVAPYGNDNNSGTEEDEPFATIGRAKDAVRSIISAGMGKDICVIIKEGTYYQEEALVFDEYDSGNNGYKVIYTAYPWEEPKIVGGKRLEGWQVDETFSGQLEGKVHKLYIPEVYNSEWSFDQLFENGKRAGKTRYPDKGYLTTDENLSRTEFKFKEGDIPQWADYSGAEIYFWNGKRFFVNVVPISNIDYTNRKITLTQNLMRSDDYANDYCIRGVKELISEPGEFHLDKSSGYLYYYPMNEEIENQEIMAPVTKELIKVMGSSENALAGNIVFEGLSLSCSKFTDYFKDGIPASYNGVSADNKYGAVHIENAENITITNNKIFNIGYTGVLLNNYAKNNIVSNNLIYDCGYYGVLLVGKEETDENNISYHNNSNTVTSNYINNCGKAVGHAGGVYIWQSGENAITHNVVRDMDRYGIAMKGIGIKVGTIYAPTQECITSNSNEISYNDVSFTNNDSQDSGAISFFSPGWDNQIINNRIHNQTTPVGFSNGIYLDGQTDYTTVENNLIYKIKTSDPYNIQEGKAQPLNIKGIGNRMTNNTLIAEGVENAIVRSTKGDDLELFDHEYLNNVFYIRESGSYLYHYLHIDDWNSNVVSKADLNLYYEPSSNYSVNFADKYNTPDLISLDEWQEEFDNKRDQFSVKGDPLFMDEENDDYRFEPTSPIFALGTKPVNVADIGTNGELKYFKTDSLDSVYVKSGDDMTRIDIGDSEEIQLEVVGRTADSFWVDLSDATVTYTSDNTSAATVSAGGLVTGVSQGIANITAEVSKNGTVKSDTIQIVVGDAVDYVELLLNKPETVLGGKVQFKLRAMTELGFERYLDTENAECNEAIMDIDLENGIMTAVGYGETIINAGVTEGGQMYQASADVFVGTEIISDTYDDMDTGARPLYYKTSISPADENDESAVTVEDIPNTTNRAIKICDDNANSTPYVTAVRSFVPSSGKVISEFKVRAEQTNGTIKFTLSDENNNKAVQFGLSGSGTFRYWTSLGQADVGAYSASQLYSVRIEMDFETAKYDLYVDDVLKINQQDFLNTATESISKLDISSTYGSGVYYVDDVMIKTLIVHDEFTKDVCESAPEGYAISATSPSTVTVEEIPGTTNNAMSIYDDNINSQPYVTAVRSFVPSSGKVVSEFKVRAEQTTGTIKFTLSDENDNKAIQFGLSGSGTFRYWTSLGQSDVGAYLSAQLYSVRVEMDFETAKYDLYVDDVLKINQQDFLNTATKSISKLDISSTYKNGTYYIDDINVYVSNTD